MSASLYVRYLVADMLVKRIESVGALPGSIYFIGEGEVHASLGYGSYGDRAVNAWSTPEAREEVVNAFLSAYPDAQVSREPDYSGKPQMIVQGVTNLGVAWQIDFRDGACEKVQVGTKTVEKYDSDALMSVPKVTVEEPVFEYRCPDPIVAAGLAS